MGDETRTRIFRTVSHNPQALRGVAENLRSLQEDLEVARKIQNRLLPAPPAIPGWDLACYYQPAGEVGGDFYDFFPLPDGRLAILVADASGKGLAGALLMVEARAVLRAIASMAKSPRQILTAANHVLLSDLDRGMFVTIFLAVLDAGRRTLTMASAGHTPLMLHHAATRRTESHAPPGLVLGAASEKMFTDGMREETVELEPGDRFLLFTDGVSELMNPVQVEYGFERIEKFMNQRSGVDSGGFLQLFGDQLEMHRAGQPQSDDITIVTGRVT